MESLELNIVDDPVPFVPSRLRPLTAERTLVVDHRENIYVLLIAGAPAPVAHLVACATSQHTVKIYDRTSFTVTQQLDGHKNRITALTWFLVDGKPFLASSSWDATVRVWDISTGKQARFFQVPGEELAAVAVSGVHLCVGTNSGKVIRYNLDTGRRVAVFEDSHMDEVTAVKFHPTNRTKLLSASHDGLVCVFDMEKATEDDALTDVLNNEQAVAKFSFFGPEGEYIACTTPTEEICLWNLMEQKLFLRTGLDFREKLTQHTGCDVNYLTDVVWFPHNSTVVLIAGANDGRGFAFEINGSEIKPLVTLMGHTDVIREAVSTVDGKLLTCGDDGKLFQWDLSGNPPNSPSHSSSSSSSSGSKIKRVPNHKQRDSPF